MPNTNRMIWPFPAKDRDPWFEFFEQMVTAMDSSGYASREDRQIIMGGGGDVSFDASTDTLDWSVALDFYSLIAGFRISVAATSVTILDGEVLYLDLTRAPTQNIGVVTVIASSVPNTDNAYALAVRVGTTIYWRHGAKLESGETINIFGAPGSQDQGDTYERHATFTVANGSATEEATIGRTILEGSLIGLSAELTDGVTGGTVDVSVKVNAVTKLTVQLSVGSPVVAQITSGAGVLPIGTADAVTVEVVASGYVNGSAMDAGLTVDVAFATGVLLPPGGLPDASGSVKGVTRLSLDPVTATAPIAVGDNDPRVYETRRITRVIAQPADGSSFNVTITPAMPSTGYIVIHTLATVVSHFTVSAPESGRTTGQFSVVTSADPANGDTIYFVVMEN